jgi:carotenoid cleavage dioxygenase
MKEVDGAPTDINGVYLRNGPNAAHMPTDLRYHMFDGDGMVHGVRIKDGKF